jgi:heat shock protein HslJ
MRRLVSLALALAVVACGSDDSSTTPTNSSVAGTWTLQTVNGAALPYTASPAPTKVEILSNTVTATSAGTWTSATQVRTTIGTQAPVTATQNDAGTYTLSGNNVAINSTANGAIGTGTISGNTLTLTQAAGVFVYKKQ